MRIVKLLSVVGLFAVSNVRSQAFLCFQLTKNPKEEAEVEQVEEDEVEEEELVSATSDNDHSIPVYDSGPLIDWIECLEHVFPKALFQEALKLRQKYYKNQTALEVTMNLCAETPQFVAGYAGVLKKFLKTIPADLMLDAAYQVGVCSNNTAFKFPLKDRNGKPMDPYSVTLANLPKMRGATAAAKK